jgi:hypothetical protein
VKKPVVKDTKAKSNMKTTKNTQKAAPRVGGKR